MLESVSTRTFLTLEAVREDDVGFFKLRKGLMCITSTFSKCSALPLRSKNISYIKEIVDFCRGKKNDTAVFSRGWMRCNGKRADATVGKSS